MDIFPQDIFLANILPTKSTKTPLNPWKTWALFCWPKPDTAAWQWWKNRKHTWIGIAQLSCSCFWAMFDLFCSYAVTLLKLFCRYFAAILKLFARALIWICHFFFVFEGFLQGLSGNKLGFHKDFAGKFVGLENQEKPSQTVWQATLWSSFSSCITNCVFNVA